MPKKKGSTPMDTALNYLSLKARTVRETERYLDAQNYGEYEVYQVIERLKELGYLDDGKYAETFIETRLATKPLSRRKLKEQLYAHELPLDIIEAALSRVDDECENQNALETAKKYYRQFASLEETERLQRTGTRLAARGYDFDTIKYALNMIVSQEEGEVQ